jgi:hypothetical protein
LRAGWRLFDRRRLGGVRLSDDRLGDYRLGRFGLGDLHLDRRFGFRQNEVRPTEAEQPALDLCRKVTPVTQDGAALRRQSRQEGKPFVGLERRCSQHGCGDGQRVFREEPDEARIGLRKRQRACTRGTDLDRHRQTQQAQPGDGRFVNRRPTATHQVDQLPPCRLRTEIGGHVGGKDRLQAIVEPHIVPRLPRA